MRFLGSINKGHTLYFIPFLPIDQSDETGFIDEEMRIRVDIPPLLLERLSNLELIVLDLSIALIREDDRERIKKRSRKAHKRDRHPDKRNLFYAERIKRSQIQAPESFGIHIYLKEKNESFYSAYGLSENRSCLVFVGKRLYRTSDVRRKQREILSFKVTPYDKESLFDHGIYSYKTSHPMLGAIKYTFAIPRTSRIKKIHPKTEREALFIVANEAFEKDYSDTLYKMAESHSSYGELYELYLFVKFKRELYKRGYSLLGKERFEYSHSHNSQVENTYICKRGNTILTLYYQGIISSSGDKSENGIELISVKELSTPDFIIKKQERKKVDYFILEAKFKTPNKIKQDFERSHSYSDIKTVNPIEKIHGPIIIYGIPGEKDENESLFGIYPGEKKGLKELFELIEK